MWVVLGQWIVASLVVIAVHTTVAEFVEIQELSGPELRERFELPDACEPSVAAMQARRERVMVLISCGASGEDDRTR